MRRVEAEHQPVEEPPARRWALDEQPVHLRGQPGDADDLAERRLAAHILAVYAHDAAFAARRIAAGADEHCAAARFDRGRDRPAARGVRIVVIRCPAVEIRESRITQTAAWR